MTKFIAAIAAIITIALVLPLTQNGRSSASDAGVTDNGAEPRPTTPGLSGSPAAPVGSVSLDEDAASTADTTRSSVEEAAVEVTAIDVTDDVLGADSSSAIDRFGPISSPDVGDDCAASLDAADIT